MRGLPVKTRTARFAWIPVFPAVGAVHELGETDEIPEAVESTQVVPEVAPLVVRSAIDRHGARAGGWTSGAGHQAPVTHR